MKDYLVYIPNGTLFIIIQIYKDKLHNKKQRHHVGNSIATKYNVITEEIILLDRKLSWFPVTGIRINSI